MDQKRTLKLSTSSPSCSIYVVSLSNVRVAACTFAQSGASTDLQEEKMQISASIPVALAIIDCDGDETSLLQRSSSPPDLRSCFVDYTDYTDGTILACANSDTSAICINYSFQMVSGCKMLNNRSRHVQAMWTAWFGPLSRAPRTVGCA